MPTSCTEAIAIGHTITNINYLPTHWECTCGVNGTNGSAGYEAHRRNLEAQEHANACSARHVNEYRDESGLWTIECVRCGFKASGYLSRREADDAFHGNESID